MRTIQLSDDQCKLLCELLKNNIKMFEKFYKKSKIPKMRNLADSSIKECNNLLEILK